MLIKTLKFVKIVLRIAKYVLDLEVINVKLALQITFYIILAALLIVDLILQALDIGKMMRNKIANNAIPFA